MELFDYQLDTLGRVRDAFKQGYKFPVLVEPTGAGKTVEMMGIAREAVAKDKRVIVYSNRKILVKQAAEKMGMGGVDCGILAAGHMPKVMPKVQIASIQSVYSWVKAEKIEKPKADLCIIDEIHSNTAKMAKEIMSWYPLKLGVTATPVGLLDVCDCIVHGTTYSQLRELGRLVPCDVYAPSEVDMKGVAMVNGEFSQKGMRERVTASGIFGDVLTHFRRLNPWQKPTLVFAPGVKESRHLVENVFRANGISAEHIDGETPDYERIYAFERHAAGELIVLSSCGVLREGFDAPWATHGILLQPTHRLSTYIQIVGRLLRSSDGKGQAHLQDHVGAWHRHGPPDRDRDWTLDSSDRKARQERKEAIQRGEGEGICCPKCQFIRTKGKQCPNCGFEHVRSVRTVRTHNGTLKKMVGNVIKKKRQQTDEDIWKGCLYACHRAGKTLAQASWWWKKKAGKPFYQADLPDWLKFESRDRDKRPQEVFPWLK